VQAIGFGHDLADMREIDGHAVSSWERDGQTRKLIDASK
jgi:hypothetical protein